MGWTPLVNFHARVFIWASLQLIFCSDLWPFVYRVRGVFLVTWWQEACILRRRGDKWVGNLVIDFLFPEIILDMCSVNERMRYHVTPSIIGQAHTQNDPRVSPPSCNRCLYSSLGVILIEENDVVIYDYNDNTVKPVYNDHLIGYFSAFWRSSRRQILLARVNWYLQSSSKHITELNTGNKSYYRGGRYKQVSLYWWW